MILKRVRTNRGKECPKQGNTYRATRIISDNPDGHKSAKQKKPPQSFETAFNSCKLVLLTDHNFRRILRIASLEHYRFRCKSSAGRSGNDNRICFQTTRHLLCCYTDQYAENRCLTIGSSKWRTAGMKMNRFKECPNKSKYLPATYLRKRPCACLVKRKKLSLRSFTVHCFLAVLFW